MHDGYRRARSIAVAIAAAAVAVLIAAADTSGGRPPPAARLLLQSAVSGSGDEVAVVRNATELREALESGSAEELLLLEDLSLRVYNGWSSDRPLRLNRSVSLLGPSSGRMPKLDMSGLLDLTADQPTFAFIQADAPVNLTFHRLRVSGVPFIDVPNQPIFQNMSMFFDRCLIDFWILDDSTEWTSILTHSRPDGFVADTPYDADSQSVLLANRDICSDWAGFTCPRAKVYVQLVDTVFHWQGVAAANLSEQQEMRPSPSAGSSFGNRVTDEAQQRGLFRATETMMTVAEVAVFRVNDTEEFGKALKNEAGDMTLALVDDSFSVWQVELGCPIVISLDLMIMGIKPSEPPVDLIDFQFSMNCSIVPDGTTVTVANLLLNNTVASSPNVADVFPFQTLIPFFRAEAGATLIIENVVWDARHSSEFPFTAGAIIGDIVYRNRPVHDNSSQEDQIALLVDDDFCASEFISGNRECLIRSHCFELAQCPEGGVWADDVAYDFFGATYKILHSLLAPREVPAATFSSRLAPTSSAIPDIDGTTDGKDDIKTAGGGDDKAPIIAVASTVGLAVAGLLIVGTLLFLTRYRSKDQEMCKGDACIVEFEDNYTKILKESVELFPESMDESMGSFTEDIRDEQQHIAVKMFGNIKLGRLLGHGGFARVYKATWKGAIVAVKVIMHAAGNPKSDTHIEREVHFMSELRHPNIVQQYQAATRVLEKEIDQDDLEGKDIVVRKELISREASERAVVEQKERSAERMSKKETWIVLEYCDRGTLSNAIDNGWFFKDEDRSVVNMGLVIYTAQDIARGFQYLHENRTIHGDLKSHNILLTTSVQDMRGWSAKIADFGVSRRIGKGSHIYTGTAGTMMYMPPEMLENGKLSEKADVYAFGLIMWELVTGLHPFRGFTPVDVWRMVVVEAWRPTFPPDINIAYLTLATRCWDQDPAERPSFDIIHRELSEIDSCGACDEYL